MNIRVLGKVDERRASVRARRRRKGMSVRDGRRRRAKRRGGGISRKLKRDHSFHFQFILQSEALPLYHAIQNVLFICIINLVLIYIFIFNPITNRIQYK